MFGRRKKKEDEQADSAPVDSAQVDQDVEGDAEPELDAPVGALDGGPFDITELAEDEEPANTRLDLGSVFLPMPDGAQLQVEMSPEGAPQNVHLVTQYGRITVSAYAAPKSPGQWREVASELAESLRADNAEVSIESGPWGREVAASTPNADLRFIGVDGPRWMVRCVVAGPAGAIVSDGPLVATARAVLLNTVIKRGNDPHPVRTPLPVVLPQVLVEQLQAAHAQQVAAQQQAAQEQAAQQGTAAQPQAQQQSGNGSEPPRRGESGSAMQQLGL